MSNKDLLIIMRFLDILTKLKILSSEKSDMAKHKVRQIYHFTYFGAYDD